jgi:hypothetical protein
MDITGKTIWQQASGDTDRDYSDICIKWGVILNGPGEDGPWPDSKKVLQKTRKQKKITDIWRFSEEVKDGDLVVLRTGTRTVPAVGQVVGGYEWHDGYGDIDGWDLQHVRRVRWLWKDLHTPKTFGTYALKMGDTTQKLNDGPVKKWLSSLEVTEDAYTHPLPVLPEWREQKEIPISEISEFLFDKGVASASISNLVNEIDELRRIAKWYQRSKMGPSEHETVAYLVVPLLRALGWTPQRMAVEWKHVDLALFEQLPRDERSLQVVVEAKKMNYSCLTARSQAEAYADGKSRCHRLIVTDGLRYGVFVREEGEKFQLFAYMNLTRLRPDCIVYGCKGAKEALLAMAPEWKPTDDSGKQLR